MIHTPPLNPAATGFGISIVASDTLDGKGEGALATGVGGGTQGTGGGAQGTDGGARGADGRICRSERPFAGFPARRPFFLTP